MSVRRERHRRRLVPVTRFPLRTDAGELILFERRLLPTRRLNDIVVREISCEDFISQLH
jgi:hypothetical protein